ncbi:hypothetical protein E2C01_036853 [Portunus trituberculatus]|uniref:Uncharacterized protein n=1 Tax=Portunus trituberculatus TaxID=210409 RepID=A0A5B7F9T7_PORTR|nr:hypothetical protein [Portunus trituberculatus]
MKTSSFCHRSQETGETFAPHPHTSPNSLEDAGTERTSCLLTQTIKVVVRLCRRAGEQSAQRRPTPTIPSSSPQSPPAAWPGQESSPSDPPNTPAASQPSTGIVSFDLGGRRDFQNDVQARIGGGDQAVHWCPPPSPAAATAAGQGLDKRRVWAPIKHIMDLHNQGPARSFLPSGQWKTGRQESMTGGRIQMAE